jgi:hypothetical protein
MGDIDVGAELRFGRKTFFVVPEVSLFPEEYMKSYFMKGFETYFIDDDHYCPLEEKIHTLFSLFSDIILFINIDRPIQGIQWGPFIRNLQQTYREHAIIGVMYRRRNSPGETREIEKMYLYDIGITGGCIPIEYQKNRNLSVISNVLGANQANGQRRHLRSLCDNSYRMNLRFRGCQCNCVLRDISISHFSCVFTGEDPSIPLHEKIADIQMNLRGVLVKVNAVLSLKRDIGEEKIHVFVFRSDDDHEGLSPDNRVRINEIIYNSFHSNMFAFLKSEFDDAHERLMEKMKEQPIPVQWAYPHERNDAAKKERKKLPVSL